MFVFHAGYDPIALTVELADLPVAILARIRCDRVFSAAPTPVRGRLGRPPRHGAHFLCVDPASAWTRPAGRLQIRRCRPATSSTAGCGWPVGVGCIPSWPGVAAGATAPPRRS